MKKNIRKIVALFCMIALMFGAVSCNKEDDAGQIKPQKVTKQPGVTDLGDGRYSTVDKNGYIIECDKTGKPILDDNGNVIIIAKAGVSIQGNMLVKDGRMMNLHGYCMTPSSYFNGIDPNTNPPKRYWEGGDKKGAVAHNKKMIDQIEAKGWKTDFIRFHMDPSWVCSSDYGGDESKIWTVFSEEKFKDALENVYLPIIEHAIAKGKYIIMRPPGVTPHNINTGDGYQSYLKKVWGIVSSHSKICNNPYIGFELSNEPVEFGSSNFSGWGNNDNAWKEYVAYMQSIVDVIRENCDNICYMPGLSYQMNYQGYAKYPIKGGNIGYAAHCYPGWFGSQSEEKTAENEFQAEGDFRTGWNNQVACVSKLGPIVITEMDWSPNKYNSGSNPISSWGKASTSQFGAPMKKITDETGNVSWVTFTWPEKMIQVDTESKTVTDWRNDPEACVISCWKWFKEYAEK